ncbi:hypothetical protein D3C71_918480 [compost metagenome]
MPMLKMPENSAIATSVASEARVSTLDCIDRAKEIIATPHTDTSRYNSHALPRPVRSNNRQAASVPMAVNRKPRGQRRP